MVGKTLTEVLREAELVNDITGILYSYMGKLYRMRRKKKISYEKKALKPYLCDSTIGIATNQVKELFFKPDYLTDDIKEEIEAWDSVED